MNINKMFYIDIENIKLKDYIKDTLNNINNYLIDNEGMIEPNDLSVLMNVRLVLNTIDKICTLRNKY